MAHREDARSARVGSPPPASGHVVHDRSWARDLRGALCSAGVLLVLLLLIDGSAGDLSWWRAALWLALAVLLFLVLCPVRVSAGEGWLATRRLVGGQRVRTDLLVSVRCLGGVSQRLVLRDVFGARVEIDPQVLLDNPDLWYRVAEDARASAAAGSLLCGGTALARLAERVDREQARTVFRVSGME
ncbi:hypothetical protein [Streptomyces tropicalis]|uniref:DUF304 domain-containing protein n=1 Tax=Streptomyces tropicalis TaxID=3034234 RepID=A0ABT6A5M3_9ACTN|nr:hypothetical protein [Streptomyces tropicalis]MDF3299661.1 hypothetical protein [Streptomyces tropicalis]